MSCIKKILAQVKKIKYFSNCFHQSIVLGFLQIISFPVFPASPSAGGSGMPWESPLNKILNSIQGPVARVFILISIIVCGIGMAFGEHGGGFKKIMGIAFGGSVVIGAVSFVSTLFGATF